MGKRCIYCGAELDDEALFCDECGKKQDDNAKRELEEFKKREQAAKEAAEREAEEKRRKSLQLEAEQKAQEEKAEAESLELGVREMERRLKEAEEAKVQSQETTDLEAKKEFAEKVEAGRSANKNQTVDKKNNPAIFAIIGLILGIVSIMLLCFASIISILTAIVGLIIAIIGLKSKKKVAAIVGIILNVLVLGLCVWAITSGSSEEGASENVTAQMSDSTTESEGDSSESTEIIEVQPEEASNKVSQENVDDESIIPATSFSDLSMIDTLPCMFQINGEQYSIAGLTMEQVKTLFPNVEKYDENAVIDQDAGIVFFSENNKNIDGIYIGNEEIYLYKGIHTGMTKKQVNAKLGKPDQDDGDGWNYWYYDVAGESVKEEDAVYIVCVEYDDNDKAVMLTLGHYQHSVTNAILVSIDNRNGFLDLNNSDIEVYLDGEYMVSIAKGDVRILMLPYDEKTHKITVKKSGEKKRSITFSSKECEDLDGTEFGIGYEVNYSLGVKEIIKQTDFYYAYDEFLYLYVLVIDGKPVDLSEIDMSQWPQELYNFTR